MSEFPGSTRAVHAAMALLVVVGAMVTIVPTASAQDSPPPEATSSEVIDHPMIERMTERGLLDERRNQLAAVISTLAPTDPRIEPLLVAELFTEQAGLLPSEEVPAEENADTLVVPVYAAPLFARLRQITADLQAVDFELALQNAGPSMGLGLAAFPVQSGYEYVNSWGAGRSGGRSHKGTDILNPRGTPIVAIESGVIERFSNHALGGLAIYLRGDSGSLYYYAHLESFGPQQEGDRVEVGEVIGSNGDSGNARGTPHLHFQWSPSGDQGGWVNPYDLLVALQGQRFDPGRG